MVNQEDFMKKIEKKGKTAVMNEIIKGFQNNKFVFVNNMSEQREKELSRFNTVLPFVLDIMQDENYLKNIGVYEQYKKDFKKRRDFFKTLKSDEEFDYDLRWFAEWVVENPEYSYTFDYRKNYDKNVAQNINPAEEYNKRKEYLDGIIKIDDSKIQKKLNIKK